MFQMTEPQRATFFRPAVTNPEELNGLFGQIVADFPTTERTLGRAAGLLIGG